MSRLDPTLPAATPTDLVPTPLARRHEPLRDALVRHNAAPATASPYSPARRPRVVVLGGTGFIGLSVCEHLVRDFGAGDARVLVPTRRLVRGMTQQALPTVELVVADVHDDAHLAQVLRGADAVVNLVGILNGRDADFERAHAELPRRLAATCLAIGVPRLVHVSALGATADGPSRYLRSKAAGEAALERATPALDVTVLRPSVVYGVRDRFTQLFASMVRVLPVLMVPGAASRMQPVWVEDLARAVVRCLKNPETIGKTYEIVGPDVLRMDEMVRTIAQAAGKERVVIGLPDPLARLNAMIFEALSSQPLLSRDNLDSMTRDNVATSGLPRLEQLGIQPAAFAPTVARWLADREGPARMEAWRSKRV